MVTIYTAKINKKCIFGNKNFFELQFFIYVGDAIVNVEKENKRNEKILFCKS